MAGTVAGVVLGAAVGVAAGYYGANKSGSTTTQTQTNTQTVTSPITSTLTQTATTTGVTTATTTQTLIQPPPPLSFTLNGVAYAFDLGSNSNDVKSYDTLAYTIRETLGFLGTKEGCKEGDCGACTVLANGKPIASCLTLTCECSGMDITTIEGLATDNTLHPIQQAFVDNFGTQCGFCTPGMILQAKALLDQNPTANEAEIRTAISGNLCRCTGYVGIVKSILAAESVAGAS